MKNEEAVIIVDEHINDPSFGLYIQPVAPNGAVEFKTSLAGAIIEFSGDSPFEETRFIIDPKVQMRFVDNVPQRGYWFHVEVDGKKSEDMILEVSTRGLPRVCFNVWESAGEYWASPEVPVTPVHECVTVRLQNVLGEEVILQARVGDQPAIFITVEPGHSRRQTFRVEPSDYADWQLNISVAKELPSDKVPFQIDDQSGGTQQADIIIETGN